MRTARWIAPLAAFFLIFGSVVVRADPTCTCGPDTKNPGRETLCDDYAAHMCTCMNECGTQSTPASGGVNPQVAKGAVNFFGTIAFVLILAVAPGAALRMLDRGKNSLPSRAAANKAWRKQLAEVRAYEERGVGVRTLGEDLIRIEKDAVRDDAIAKDQMQRLQFNPPGLKPSRAYLCDRAAVELPFTTGGTLAGFATVEDMLLACGPFEAPSAPDDPCAATSLVCGDVCCPAGRPVLNACDHQCYRTSDFRGGKSEGMTCARFTRCGPRAP